MTNDDDSSDEPLATPRPRSKIGDEVARLHEATNKAIESRGRLPQPLFWSLFGHAIADIKRKKETRRLVRSLFSGDEES